MSLLQYITATTAAISVAGIATGQGWTSPSLPHLKSNDSELHITDSEAVWISSILDLGSFTGDVLSPIISSFMGRKYFLLNATILQLISWILIIFAKNVNMLYIARFMIGIGGNAALNFSMIYIGETAEKERRGKLLFLVKISIGIGLLAVKTAGAFLSYRAMNIAMLCLIFPFFLMFPFIPESPYYLLIKNRKEDAVKVLKRLRGSVTPEVANFELDRVQNAVMESQNIKAWAIRDLFCNEGNRKSFYVVMTAMATTFLSGRITVIAYTQEIIGYSDFFLSPEQSAMLLGAIELIMIIVGAQTIEYAGRRRIFLISGSIGVFSLGIFGLFFFLKLNLEVDTSNFNWIPFTCLSFYAVTINLGLCSVFYVLLGEIFSLNVKVTAISISVASCDIISFLSKIVFDWMNRTVGIYANFWMYAFCCFFGTLTFFFIAPETKGKSLEEIQNILKTGNKMGENSCSTEGRLGQCRKNCV